MQMFNVQSKTDRKLVYDIQELRYAPSCKFHLDWYNISPLRGEKLKNRLLSKNNTMQQSHA